MIWNIYSRKGNLIGFTDSKELHIFALWGGKEGKRYKNLVAKMLKAEWTGNSEPIPWVLK